MVNRETLSDNELNKEYSMQTELFPFYAIIHQNIMCETII
jgi:hypothetical protein